MLGWVVVNDTAEEYEVRPSLDQLPGLCSIPVAEQKTKKNHLHLDFRPDDQHAEVERLVSLGATRVDIGHGKEPRTVKMAPVTASRRLHHAWPRLATVQTVADGGAGDGDSEVVHPTVDMARAVGSSIWGLGCWGRHSPGGH